MQGGPGMRFDPEYGKYFYNDEMILSPEGKEALYENYRAFAYKAISNPVGSVREAAAFQEEAGESRQGPGALILSACIVFAFFGVIAAFILRKGLIAGGIIAALLIASGLMLLIKPKVLNHDSNLVMPAIMRINGLILLAGAGFIIYAIINHDKYTQTQLFTGAFLILFGMGAVILLLQSIAQFVAPSKVYTEEVNATCVGYARYLESSKGHHYTIMTSPVFEYNYEGEKYLSTYDTFVSKRDGTIPVGSRETIKISPDHPSHVLGSYKPLGFIFLGFGIMCLAVAGIVGFIFISGQSESSELSFTGPAEPAYSNYIDDDLVTAAYGDDWYIEKAVLELVEQIRVDGETYVHVVINDEFKDVYTGTDFEYSTGDEVYVIYGMTEQDGELIKDAYTVSTTEDTGYRGAHGAYEP